MFDAGGDFEADDLFADLEHPGGVLPPDVRKSVDRQAVRAIRTNAGNHFESDGFDMDMCEDAANAVEAAGFREAIWYTSPDVVDDVREWYDEQVRCESPVGGLEPAVMVANRPVRQAPEGVFEGDEMLLIGDGAVVPSPLPVSHVVVREPNGVAVVRL